MTGFAKYNKIETMHGDNSVKIGYAHKTTGQSE